MPNTTSTQYAVVIEWGDGTVDVNGPYDSEHAVRNGVSRIATALARDEDRVLKINETCDHAIIGTDGEDQIDVYTRKMGEPIR